MLHPNLQSDSLPPSQVYIYSQNLSLDPWLWRNNPKARAAVHLHPSVGSPRSNQAVHCWDELVRRSKDAFCRVDRPEELSLQRNHQSAQQTCSSLLFTECNFAITYWPGASNVKPDTLSQQFSENLNGHNSLLCPESLTSGNKQQVHQTEKTDPDPGTGLPSYLCGPVLVHSQVISLAYSSRLACLLEVSHTILLNHLEFYSAFSVCAQNNSSHQPPFGLLKAPSVPNCLWSHFGLDFVTGHPFYCEPLLLFCSSTQNENISWDCLFISHGITAD